MCLLYLVNVQFTRVFAPRATRARAASRARGASRLVPDLGDESLGSRVTDLKRVDFSSELLFASDEPDLANLILRNQETQSFENGCTICLDEVHKPD